jgi:hypothetical protein
VSWFTLESLTATIARSRIDATTGKVVERIVRSELSWSTTSAFLPAGADEALYRLVDAAYEKRSLILTWILPPARFDTIFPKGLVTVRVGPAAPPRSRHRDRGRVAPANGGGRREWRSTAVEAFT